MFLRTLLVFLVLQISVEANAANIIERLQGLTVGAHQGGIFSLKPNTIKQFEKAKRQGVDILEMDLRLTKDGEVIVFHDEKLNLMTNCKGEIAAKTLVEIKKCSLIISKEKIPAFREVLAWANGSVVINAEFKTREVVGPAIDLIKEFQAHDWVFFQTKSDSERYYTARKKDQNVALLFAPHNLDQLDWALNLNDENLIIIELHKKIRTPDVIKKIHESGKLALEDSWHFSFHQELFRASCEDLFKQGIDIAITNRASSCLNQRAEFESEKYENLIAEEFEEGSQRIGKNFHEIVKGEFYRSAQLKKSDLADYITKFGIKSVINLRGAHPGEDWFDDEIAVTQALGVNLVNIGMSAGRLPHRKDLLALLEAFSTLPQPLLVHCRAGADRTGEAAAIYLFDFKGKSKNESIKMLTAKYHHLATFTPAKRYFFNDIYQGKEWAVNNYDPCKSDYKYYEKEKYCGPSH